MFSFVIALHMVVCALLIMVVLIQQGRGGGLIDSMSSAESLFGTKTNTLLVKSTSLLAVIFFITCLSLAFMSIQRNKSLIETRYQPPASAAAPTTPAAAAPTTPAAAATTVPAAPVTPTPDGTPTTPK